MTREEAIDLLDNLIGMIEDNHESDYDTALKMAIKALEQEPCEDAVSRQAVLDYIHRILNQGTGKKKSFEFIQKYVEKQPPVKPQPCEDAISRSAAIKAIDERAKRIKNEDTLNGLAGAVGVLFDLPPVKPQEPKWIPVSERLPKPNECVGNVCRYCLIQNEYGDMMVARWDGQGWEQMYQYGEYIEDEVIAWMPLPKPYEPQENCDTCRYKDDGWDSEHCDGCCGNHSGFEPQESEE